MINIGYESIIYSLINILAPNEIKTFMNKNANGTIISGGDMNDALKNLDRKKEENY